jgi:hypothetical protein
MALRVVRSSLTGAVRRRHMSPFASELCCGAGTDEGPSMYEMEGPRPALAARAADCSAAGCPACALLAGHHRPGHRPGSGLPAPGRFRGLPRIRVRWWMNFYCPVADSHKGFAPAISRFFCYPQDIAALSPAYRRLSTSSSTSRSTGCISRAASETPPASPSAFTAPPSSVARSFVARSSVQAAPRPVGSLCSPARLRGAFEAPPSLVARSSVQAAPRPVGSLCSPARLRGDFEAPPSLVARSFVTRSSVQAAPRPVCSLWVCLRMR